MSLQGPIGVAGESGLDGINGTKVNIKENINLSLKKSRHSFLQRDTFSPVL